MAELYGVEHLLRLFGQYCTSSNYMYMYMYISLVCVCCAVRIGPMLSFTVMEEDSLTLLLSHMHDFLKYACER